MLHVHNAPLRSGKGSAYEGGIREPMLVKWPAKVKPASICDEYLIIEDFFPSILEMAGVESYKTAQTIDGKSFVPMLFQKNVNVENRDLIWHFPNKWGASGPGIGTTSTIRNGDWKLIYWYKKQQIELYNIREDISEEKDLSVLYPEKVKELGTRLGKYLKSVNAQRPSYKETGQPVPWPDEQFQ